MARFQWSTVERELAAVIRALRFEERLQLVAQFSLADVFAPPRPVHRPVPRSAESVVAEVGAASAERRDERAVEVRVIRIERGDRMRHANKVITAGARCLPPEVAILGRPPARPQFVK